MLLGQRLNVNVAIPVALTSLGLKLAEGSPVKCTLALKPLSGETVTVEDAEHCNPLGINAILSGESERLKSGGGGVACTVKDSA
jgi:hypothetical protein